MSKIIKKISIFFIALFTIFSIALRTIQLKHFTSIENGCILKDDALSVFVFFILVLLAIAFCLVLPLCSKKQNNPFEIKKSKTMSALCILSAFTLFYDFVHQCVNVYEYLNKVGELQYNFLIPLCCSAFFALISTFYFMLMGLFFVSDNYDFRQFKFFHLVPAFWMLSKIMISLSFTLTKDLAEEQFLQYIVLIFGIFFFILIIRCFDDDSFNLKNMAFVSLSYAVSSFIIAVPRIISYSLQIETYPVLFSSITYLLTGIFALSFTINILKEKE